MKSTDAQFKLRLPKDLKEWIEVKAKAGYHSKQAVVLGIVAEAKRRDEQTSQA